MFVHADCESRRASVIYLDKLFLPVTNCFNLDGACSEFMPHKKCEVGTEYALDITVGNDANLVSCASFCGSMSLVCAPIMPTSLLAITPLRSSLYISYMASPYSLAIT